MSDRKRIKLDFESGVTTSYKNELKITDLNVDCLVEIVKYLHSDDLINLCQVHFRFLPPIGKVVPKKVIYIRNCVENHKSLNVFLKLFGHRITCLDLDGKSSLEARIIEGYVSAYCANGNVKSCNFDLNVLKKFIDRNTKFFESLESVDGSSEHMLYMVTKQIKLKKFNIINIQNDNFDLHGIQSAKANEIEFLKIQLSHLAQIDDLPLFTAVKVLLLQSYGPHDRMDQYLKVLLHFPNVRDLTVDVRSYFKGLDGILQLNHLKKLHLRFYCHNSRESKSTFFEQIQSQSTLESLRLTFAGSCCLSKLNFYEICKITNLKHLYLHSLFPLSNGGDLLDIAKKLEQLRSFVYDSRYWHQYGTKSTPDIICQFVQIAKNLETFIFHQEYISIEVFNQFYDELTGLVGSRETTLNMVLMVNKKDWVFYEKPVFLQKNKWLKMRML